MPVNRPVILTALMIAAASAVHSQSVNPAEGGGQPPASLCAAVPAAPAPATLNVTAESGPLAPLSNSTAPPGASLPWAFSLPKPPTADVNGAPAGFGRMSVVAASVATIIPGAPGGTDRCMARRGNSTGGILLMPPTAVQGAPLWNGGPRRACGSGSP